MLRLQRTSPSIRLLSRIQPSHGIRFATTKAVIERDPMIPPPKRNSGPIMERKANRELPVPKTLTKVMDPNFGFRWWHSFPLFALLMAVSAGAIFNYQKSSSPVVVSTLYALRTNERARALLGDEIYFKQQIPWISGQMNQVQGKINIHFTVKGTRDWGMMRFTSNRATRKGMFETSEWSLEMADGRKFDLLDDGDEFVPVDGGKGEEGEREVTRGFRQVPKR